MDSKKRYKRIFDVIFWAAIVGFVAFKFGYQRMPPSVDFENLAFFDKAGQEFSISDFENKHILINFYQSWCGPCMGEMDNLSNAYVALMDEGFVYIALSDEDFSLIDRVKARGDNKMEFFRTKSSLDEIGIRVYPTTYLLNKEGEVVFEKTDVEHWDSQETLDMFRELVR